ncbi:transcriptional repressor AgaR [Lacimicrobium alkaliphilum]|uniref:Transcriptional regulator n=1 Tax=Lacimicrobium alkaliphilum TaxID=1526571 RepID=A0A0U2ZK30_9ALTE|nr:transcriptional repressor AgaR [Lacimicrobium alkaliphilum]ALS98684.1 transcriptional regulator [Lacimicrobium alkaliphilum]
MDVFNSIERQQEILRRTQAEGKVTVKGLAKAFGVSEVTIRNDLSVLDRKKLLVRSRGGAMINSQLGRELSLKEKRHQHSALKQQLGRAAAALVQEGERIILDSGTTTQEVAVCLSDRKDLIVMTNGLNIASELAQSEHVEVMSTGGSLRKKSMSFYGTIAERSLQNYNFSKLILGVDGFDLKTGIGTHFEKEAILNRLMCQMAEEIVVVTDSSKFARRAFHVICAIENIHTLVTDDGIPQSYVDELTKLGIELHIIEREKP